MWRDIFFVFYDLGSLAVLSFAIKKVSWKKNKQYFVSKIVLNYCEKKCSSDREKSKELMQVYLQNYFLTYILCIPILSGAPRLARPPRPGPCLDFGFQQALIRNNRSKNFGLEYWALPGSNLSWCPQLCKICLNSF